MVEFRPGLGLSEGFYRDEVAPRLAGFAWAARAGAARVGKGSEVLGYDTPRSMDHDWGLIVQVFVPDDVPDAAVETARRALAAALPARYRGVPTRFAPAPEGDTRLAESGDLGVRFLRLGAFVRDRVGWTPPAPPTPDEWRRFPSQGLLELTRGRVFADPGGALARVRATLAWYPEAIWREKLAAGWQAVAAEEAFPGRCAEVGDDLGSRLVTARLVRAYLGLAFLYRRRYAPYAKWFGTAARELAVAPGFHEAAAAALGAAGWERREAALVRVAEAVAGLHNESGLTPPLDPSTRPFYSRPFRVIGAARVADALVPPGDAGP